MLLCAKIVNTHGVTGEVKAIIYADGPSFFDNIGEFSLQNGRKLHPVSIRPHKKNMLIIRFDEVKTVEDALKIKGDDLYVDRAEADELPEGRYYIVDILGLLAVTDEGVEIGKVTDVIQTGRNDVYVIKNAKGREYLVPVIDEVVKDIDIAGSRIVIKPLEGLFDDED
jgi:16S rRNA processing protein RimM